MIRYPRETCPRPRCGAPLAVVSLVPEPVGEDNGPQGSYACEAGHSDWIWPRECEVVPAPEWDLPVFVADVPRRVFQ